ncbi:MAG TPA: hypothetical protein PK728_09765 [Bacillota bacterium]|nr:hypothetical protein [Bacillota bacterium]
MSSLALAKQEIAVVHFDSPALCQPEEQKELLEVMQANFGEDVPIDFPRIKIPSGGGLTFEVPGEEESEPVKELVGVILDHYRVNAYWADEYAGAGAPPTCSALDAENGKGNPGGNCKTCPMNDWGSDAKGGRGKACKNIRRIYILTEGEMLPYLIALPPTSLEDFNVYMRRLTSKHKVPYYGALSRAKLYKTQNKDGITYSAVAWSFAGALSPQDRAAMKNYAASLKSAMRTAQIEGIEYSMDGNATGGAGTLYTQAGAAYKAEDSQYEPY